MNETSELKHDEPMARYTSWRVGGPADVYFRPRSVAALGAYLAQLPASVPRMWLGLGSNTLIRDGGIRGVVISVTGLPRTFEAAADGTVAASAALPCATFARRAARLGLGPAAFFAGIPGTIGGALAMNAGAFGGETWDNVARVRTMDFAGETHLRDRSEFTVGYRHVAGAAGECFIAADFALGAIGDSESAGIRTLLDRRSETQPIGPPSAGSVFRNPEGEHAAALIERAGFKGRRIGGAVVSPKHANFIINEGTATAADIEALILEIRDGVAAKFGIELEPEVRIVGEPA